MPRAKKSVELAKATDTPDRFRLGELGYLGLSVFDGVTTEEIKKELNFPNSLKTYKQMSYHDAINSTLTLYDNILGKAVWKYNPPPEATEEEKNQATIINQMFHDMEHSWGEFIADVLSMNIHGFSVHEKVFRKRYKSNGSKYDDGLIGWRKLPIRSQESIVKFIYDESGNDLKAVKQDISGISDPYGRYFGRKDQEVVIPVSKFLLFRQGKHRGDPFGKSLLRNCYLAWRFLTVVEELEAVGVNKELHGIPVLKLPAQYLSNDASAEQKLIRSYYENAIRNMQAGSQSGVILPGNHDPDTRQPLFDLTLLSTDGKRSFDMDKIKSYYKNAIYTALSADILILGQGSTGSFALAQFKNSVTATAARKMATIIKEVIERDLIRQTYELNGWNIERMGTVDFDGMDEIDLETFSKAVQRAGATGYLPQTLEVVNAVMSSLGIDELPEGTDLSDILPDKTTRSGDGMQEGLNSGTGDAITSRNTSDLNLDNAA